MSGSGGDLFNEEITIDATTSVTRATATTSWVAYPSSPGNNIQDFTIEPDVDASGSRRLWVALDNLGTHYTSLAPGDSMSLTPKQVKQIYVRCASSTLAFSLWMDVASS